MLVSLFFLTLFFHEALGVSRRFLVHTVLEERKVIPHGWNKRGLSDSSTFNKKSLTLPLRINLRQSNIHRAEELLLDVSSPNSKNFGKHYTPNQVIDLFAPAQDSVATVMEWLMDAGFKGVYSKVKGAVLVNMTVAAAEDLLHTEYHVYDHDTGHPHVACSSYSVPQVVREHVDFITPTLHFDVALGKRGPTHVVQDGVAKNVGTPGNSPVSPKTNGIIDSFFGGLHDCDTKITPACLEALYKFSRHTQLATKKNSYGVVAYTPQSYAPSDLDVFAKNFTPDAVGFRPQLASIDGGVLISGPPNFRVNGESNLDLQYAIGLTYPLDVTLYQVGDPVAQASFNNFLDGIDAAYCTYEGGDDPSQDGKYPDPSGYNQPEDCGKYKPTNVISTSYGYNEADLTPFYEIRQCNEYMKLGLQGVTVLYSSGDFGVAGNRGNCINPTTGAYSSGPDGTRFNPSFPGTCPWVTSVGATQINPGSTVYDPESACEQVIYSGGGFSNVFAMPDYQKKAVGEYFQNYKPAYTSTQYNNSMTTRGFPDISANGANYLVAVGGQFYNVFGTSASSPTVGAIISLLNDARLAFGKNPIGFLNPVLYNNCWALNDITSGGNQGCGTPGFTAVPGWDPVTGLGTPSYPRLLAVFLSLP